MGDFQRATINRIGLLKIDLIDQWNARNKYDSSSLAWEREEEKCFAIIDQIKAQKKLIGLELDIDEIRRWYTETNRR